jgi:hypothetical protein
MYFHNSKYKIYRTLNKKEGTNPPKIKGLASKEI